MGLGVAMFLTLCQFEIMCNNATSVYISLITSLVEFLYVLLHAGVPLMNFLFNTGKYSYVVI